MKNKTSKAMTEVSAAMDKNMPLLDQSIKREKNGGPKPTPIKRTDPNKDVTKPRRFLLTDPVIKLFTHSKINPAPMLLTARTARKRASFLNKTSPAKEIVINTSPINISFFIIFKFLPIRLPVIYE